MTFDRSLHNVSQRLRRRGSHEGVPSAAMRAHVLSGLPTVPSRSPHNRHLRFGASPQPSGVIIVICVVGVGFGTRYFMIKRHARSAATERSAAVDPRVAKLFKGIHDAVDKAETYHFECRNYHFNGTESQFEAHGVSHEPIAQWEIWGRKSPFLYREDREGETVLDNGQKRYHLIPSRTLESIKALGIASPLHRHPEVLVIRPSLGFGTLPMFAYEPMSVGNLLLGSDVTGPGASTIPTSARYSIRTGFPQSVFAMQSALERFDGTATDNVATIESLAQSSKKSQNFINNFSSRDDFTIDLATLRPKRYALTQSSTFMVAPAPKPDRDYVPAITVPSSGLLMAAPQEALAVGASTHAVPPYSQVTNSYSDQEIWPIYNRPIPESLTRVATVPGAIVFEVEQLSAGGANSSQPQFAIKGLDLSAKVIEQYESGHVAVKLDWRLNGKEADFKSITGLIPLFQWDMSVTDETGRPYVATTTDGSAHKDPWPNVCFFAPVEPLPSGASYPRRLVVRMNLLLNSLDPCGLIDPKGPGYIAPVIATIELSPAKSDGAIVKTSELLPKIDKNLQIQIDSARADYYLNAVSPSGKDGSPQPDPIVNGSFPILGRPPRSLIALTPAVYDRAVYWTKAVMTTAEQQGKKGLAKIYQWKLEKVARPR